MIQMSNENWRVLVQVSNKPLIMTKRTKISVAGTGYVGLSIATLLAQRNDVMAVDIVQERVDKVNRRQSPIQDEWIERFFAEDVQLAKGEQPSGEFVLRQPLSLTATTDW